MRIFTAIPLPEELKQVASEIFRGRFPVPYVNTSNLHITLNFFGELTDEEVKRAKVLFERSAEGQTAFRVQFDRAVKFRQQIHLTIKQNDELKLFQSRLARVFSEAGFNLQDREYYPHVKLANLHMDKIMHPERKIENFPNAELNKLNFVAERAVLYESKLLLHHAQHLPISEVIFKKA